MNLTDVISRTLSAELIPLSRFELQRDTLLWLIR